MTDPVVSELNYTLVSAAELEVADEVTEEVVIDVKYLLLAVHVGGADDVSRTIFLELIAADRFPVPWVKANGYGAFNSIWMTALMVTDWVGGCAVIDAPGSASLKLHGQEGSNRTHGFSAQQPRKPLNQSK